MVQYVKQTGDCKFNLSRPDVEVGECSYPAFVNFTEQHAMRFGAGNYRRSVDIVQVDHHGVGHHCGLVNRYFCLHLSQTLLGRRSSS